MKQQLINLYTDWHLGRNLENIASHYSLTEDQTKQLIVIGSELQKQETKRICKTHGDKLI